MAAQRRTFRIEEIMQAAEPMMAACDRDVTAAHNELLAEIRALRASMEARQIAAAEPRPEIQSREVRKLKIELDVIDEAIRHTRSEILSLQDRGFDSSRVARVARELEVAFGEASIATERVLKAAEGIDESATTLSKMLKSGNEQRLAQDIQDHIVSIFEACNFHDLTGQRISKVSATLKMVEDHLARMMEIWSAIDRFNIADAPSAGQEIENVPSAPRLDGENGRSNQDRIDKRFG